MTSERDFFARIDRLRAKHPFHFEEREQPATDAEIRTAEGLIAAALPSEYRRFLLRYGGGYFCFTNVFSVWPESDWFLPDHQFADGFVAFSSDQSGGYYGFKRSGGALGDDVYYFYPPEDDPPRVAHPSFFDFVWTVGISHLAE